MERYDIEIERKGESKLKFNLCDSQGRPSKVRGSFRMSQFPQLSLKMQQGDTMHSDREPPYASTEQRDFSGGRGWDNLERDKSRFYDSYRAQTWIEGMVLPGAEETYAEGIRGAVHEYWWDDNQHENEDYGRIYIYNDDRYFSHKFTPSADITPTHVYVAMGLDYDKDNWETEIMVYDDDGGEPGSKLFGTGALTPDAYEEVRRFAFVSPTTLSGSTTYHLVIQNYEPVPDTAWNEKGYYYIGEMYPDSGQTHYSEDGITWAEYNKAVFFRLVEDDEQFDTFFFEHLGALYAALSFRDGSSDPKIFMNGERGTVTGATSTVITDTGASFTVDEIIGSLLVLYSGLGSDVDRPWRLVTDNDGTTITVDAPFDETPDETTRYVVVHRDKFFEVTGHGMTGRITDVCVYANIVYFARGDFRDIYHMYDDTFSMESGNKGTFITVAPDSITEEMRVYLARASFPPRVYAATPTFGDDGVTVADLDFSGDTAVGDSSCEDDDGSWADYNSPTTNEQYSLIKYDGQYCRRIVTSGANEGATQTITVTAGATYKVTAYMRLQVGASGCALEFDGTELDSMTQTGRWVKMDGYKTIAGATATLRFISKGGAGTFFFDAVSMQKVDTPLPVGHEKITGLGIAGDPRRLYVFTDAGVLRETSGVYRDVSPGEFKSARDYRNGAAHAKTGAEIYLTFLDNVVKYSDENISIIGPNLDEGLPENRRGTITSMVMYGEWLLCAVDGGTDNMSSILLFNQLGWHEYYRAPAAGVRITDLFIQPMPGDYVDRLWFNEGADLVYLHIDVNPVKNDKFRYAFSSWVEMATVYGEMSEVEKFFHSIKMITDECDTTHYISAVPRDPDGYNVGTSPPTGETVETLWGTFTSTPVDENRIDQFWGMEYFTLRRLRIHLGLHTTRATLFPILRGIVIDYLEHLPISWSYTMRLVTGDSRKSQAGEKSLDRAEDDIATLLTWVNSAEPVRIFTPFSYATDFQAKLTSVTDIVPLGYQAKSGKELTMFVLTAVDA